MADITSDVTVQHSFTNGVKTVVFETPDTADDGDTVDLGPNGKGLFDDFCVAIVANNTDGVNLADTSASGGADAVVDLPGSTDNEVREIVAIGK
jgi:hypothetical protein